MNTTRIALAIGLAFATSLLSCAIAAPAKADGLEFSNPSALFASKYYSHVVVAPNGGKTIYIAGQGPMTKEREVVPGGKEAQIKQVFANLKSALESAGATGADVVAINVYIVGYTEADLVPLGKAENALFTQGRMPTSTLVPVPRLALDSELFEVSAVAQIYPK